MKKSLYLTVMFLILSACSGEANPTNLLQLTKTMPSDTGVIEAPAGTENPSDFLAAPTNLPTPVPELEPGELPVILSYVEETDGERKIISMAVNFESAYALISVERGTKFRGQAVVDSDLNLYILYGSRINYLSKLSVEGKIETIEIPYHWSMQTGWIGDQLFVMANADSMSVINTEMEITTLSPALNDFEGDLYDGALRTTMDPAPMVIWTLTVPVVDETGVYALYRTLSLDTLTTSEYRLKIPGTVWSKGSNPTAKDAAERAGTFVYTVDLPSENVFFCNMNNEKGNTFKLELYASEIGETVSSSDYYCLNRVFDLRGNSIISMSNPVSGGETWVLGLDDLQPIFDVTEYFDLEDYYNNWIDSNGVYWQNLSKNEITVIYNDLQHDARYPIPPDLPTDLIPGTTLVSAFLIDD